LTNPRSNPTRLHFWGYIKYIVYRISVVDLENLHRRIVPACATVMPAMLQNTWRELEYRLDVCRATRGAHTQKFNSGHSKLWKPLCQFLQTAFTSDNCFESY
ncbi:hypothetical protein C0J52_10856, partial [Blattella germanica]